MKRIALVITLVFLTGSVLALAPFPKVFNDTYKPATGSALQKASCAVCHTKMGAKDLNPYGKDLKAALAKAKTKALTASILKNVEDKDSDKDGAKNGAELKSGTLPGDPKSK